MKKDFWKYLKLKNNDVQNKRIIFTNDYIILLLKGFLISFHEFFFCCIGLYEHIIH